MIFDPFDSYRLKRTVADTQCNLYYFNSALARPIKQLAREVQPRGRRCHCAALAGVHGLIARRIKPVFFVALDVRRQRRAAYAVYYLVEIAINLETNYAAAELAPLNHFCGELAARKFDSRPRQKRFARSNERFPDQRLQAIHKKNFR